MSIDQHLMEQYPYLIDGGLSNALEARGCNLNHELWTAKLLEENPEAIIQAHLDYLKSGARCILTASYQASFPGLVELGYSRDAAEKLILESVRLADLAIQRFTTAQAINYQPLIAASLGPYGAYLADGAEYRGNYGLSDELLKDFHQERIMLLDQSKADILACETIPDIQEVKVLSEILKEINKPAWVSFSCKDEYHLNDGSKIVEAASIFKKHPKVFAVGVNCTHPKYISGIIKNIKTTDLDKKIIVYPNSGEAYNAESKTWMGLSEPLSYVEMAKEWLSLGADIIGGCCRIGPDHIREMKRLFP